ncbi:hypothetical protein FQN57_003281 [Myotisia sp. PD_48]|nr:hypothetical protein FQN57_003281 [Myotisia sp. PD_48]
MMAFAISILFILGISVFAFVTKHLRTQKPRQHAEPLKTSGSVSHLSEAAILLNERISSALPNCVILPHEVASFNYSRNLYWAQQESEVVPACIVHPKNTEQLCHVVTILNCEHNERKTSYTKNPRNKKASRIFAVRSGGHSPVSRSASIQDGVLIDMSQFSEVTPSEDSSRVVIGAGAKWGKVVEILNRTGLAVSGARNSAVGVGGLVLGGGISFFSQQFGFVCNNILSYEIVLANGSVTMASASVNPDLWRALKGGGNNFGIVTRITVCSFPSTNIWSGFLFLPSWNAPKVLSTFHEYINQNHHSAQTMDIDASGPIACFTYIHQLRLQAISVNLAYTRPIEPDKKWPEHWRNSSFKSLWPFWSTCRVRSLLNACDEVTALNPPGRRQTFGTTTIQNDPATLQAAHAAYHSAIASIKRANITGMSWTLVLQPIMPSWVCKGDPNPLGLDNLTEPLVIVSFTVNWIKPHDDQLVEKLTRQTLERIDSSAAGNGKDHQYRYLNYCGGWQSPFKGYGDENFKFLQQVSQKYDPEGLFQTGCNGAFKLNS